MGDIFMNNIFDGVVIDPGHGGVDGGAVGSDTGSLAEFRYELYKHKVGDKLEVTFYRDGKKKTTSITLGKNEE